MASPLTLGLAAALALSSSAALACEGQGCWGMAPAQEKNPGYTGPDYAALYGPPPGYGPGGNDQGYGPQPGYADDGYDAGSPDPAYGAPAEGYSDDDQDADGSGAPGQGGYGDEGYGPPPPAEDRYGPQGYDDGYAGGETGGGADDGYGASASGHGASGYGAYGPPLLDGAHHGEATAYAHDNVAPGLDMRPGHDPYESAYDRGYERSRRWSDASGASNNAYRSGSVSRYAYDSGWRVQEGPSEAHAWGAPMPAPSYSVRTYNGVTSDGFAERGGMSSYGHAYGERGNGPAAYAAMGPGPAGGYARHAYTPPPARHAAPPPMAPRHAPPPPPPHHGGAGYGEPTVDEPYDGPSMAPIPDDGERG
jgi:hypothetical protein